MYRTALLQNCIGSADLRTYVGHAIYSGKSITCQTFCAKHILLTVVMTF